MKLRVPVGRGLFEQSSQGLENLVAEPLVGTRRERTGANFIAAIGITLPGGDISGRAVAMSDDQRELRRRSLFDGLPDLVEYLASHTDKGHIADPSDTDDKR